MKRTRCHLYLLSANQVLLLVAATCCGLGATKSVWGQSISVRPQDGIADERLAIRLTGLKPKEPVVIRASMQDAEGKLWQSYAGGSQPRKDVNKVQIVRSLEDLLKKGGYRVIPSAVSMPEQGM